MHTRWTSLSLSESLYESCTRAWSVCCDVVSAFDSAHARGMRELYMHAARGVLHNQLGQWDTQQAADSQYVHRQSLFLSQNLPPSNIRSTPYAGVNQGLGRAVASAAAATLAMPPPAAPGRLSARCVSCCVAQPLFWRCCVLRAARRA